MASQLVEQNVVAGRYELRAWLGEGSFGEVWSALDQTDGTDVAVKLLRPEFGDASGAVRRFDEEARALALLAHPNVVRLVDRGSWRERPFLVFERLLGGSLQEWLRRHRDAQSWTDLGDVARLFDDACAGVAAAHGLSAPGCVVHRDLKPSNLLLDAVDVRSARLKVADFGLARVFTALGELTPAEKRLTASGVVLGSVHTMAPEQAAGNVRAIGPWTDVFALGVVLTELLSLRKTPAAGLWWWGMSARREGDIPAALRSLRDDVPTHWWDVVARCLRARPEQRYPDAGALRDAFRASATEYPTPRAPPTPEAPDDERTLDTSAPSRG